MGRSRTRPRCDTYRELRSLWAKPPDPENETADPEGESESAGKKKTGKPNSTPIDRGAQ